jgi:hypothetical protein
VALRGSKFAPSLRVRLAWTGVQGGVILSALEDWKGDERAWLARADGREMDVAISKAL